MITKIDRYRYSNWPLEKINDLFVSACSRGDLELVKYLLFAPGIINAEVDYGSYKPIQSACYAKQNEIVKFLLTSKKLPKVTPINVHKGCLLRIAIETSNFEMVNYLLKNSTKMSLSQNDDMIFKSLMGNFGKNREIIKELIVTYELPKSQTIEDFLDEKNRGIEEKKTVNEWFEKRIFMKNLELELRNEAEVKPIKAKKMKV
jgi:ankyrin repeat protein